MLFLFFQTWLWILLAGLLGLLVGWLIWGHRGKADTADSALLKRQLEDCKAECKELEAARDAALSQMGGSTVVLTAGGEDIEPVLLRGEGS